MRTSIFLFTLFLSVASSAQDSTRYVMDGKLRVSGMGGPLFHVGAMGIWDKIFTSMGAGGGLLIDRTVMIGAYGQGLTGPAVHQDLSESGTMHEGTLVFGHSGAWVMWSLMPGKPVHPFISVQAGWGAAEWTFDDRYDEDDGPVPDSLRTPENKHDQVFVLTPTAGVELNMVRWFRPNIYVGYRMVNGLDLEGTEATDLDGFFAGVSFLFGGFGDRRPKQ